MADQALARSATQQATPRVLAINGSSAAPRGGGGGEVQSSGEGSAGQSIGARLLPAPFFENLCSATNFVTDSDAAASVADMSTTPALAAARGIKASGSWPPNGSSSRVATRPIEACVHAPHNRLNGYEGLITTCHVATRSPTALTTATTSASFATQDPFDLSRADDRTAARQTEVNSRKVLLTSRIRPAAERIFCAPRETGDRSSQGRGTC